MPGKGKVHWVVLAAASLLATVGIVWLALRISKESAQWSAAALDPLAIKCILLIVGGVLALALVTAVLIRLRTVGVSRKIGGDQGGTAAIEMVLLMPFALMIFLTVIQTALVFNANMVVHYAAYCASRVAVVAVPLVHADEARNLVYPCTENDQGPSWKIELIRRAAVMALVPISSSMPTDSASVDAIGPLLDQTTRSVFSKAGVDNPWWLHRTQEQYNYANAFTRISLAPPDHWQDKNPDNDCPYSSYKKDTWGSNGWNLIPFCPYYNRVPGPPIWDFWYWEDLDVRLRYDFLLGVPYGGAIYAALADGKQITVPGRTGTTYAMEIMWVGTLSNEGGPEIRPKDATN